MGASWGERTVLSNLGRNGASNTQEKISKEGEAKSLHTKEARWTHQARNPLKISVSLSMTVPES